MNYSSMNHLRGDKGLWRITAVAAAAVLSACAQLPPPDAVPQLASAQAADFAKTGGIDRAAARDWPAAAWWEPLGDAQLNQLIRQALHDSPTLAVAQARITQALATSDEVAASAGANLALSGTVSGQHYSKNYIYPPPLGGAYRTSGELDLGLSYDFDFWGRNRSELEAALGLQRAAAADADAAAVALSAAVAKTYYQWQTLQAEVKLTQDMQVERERLVGLEMRRVKAGMAAGENLHPLAADAAAPGQQLVQLNTQLEQARYQLKALLGAHEAPTLQVVALPAVANAAPADLHLDLLAHRPDVAAARDRVQASLKEVDSARAAFYPDISISAFLGLSSLQLNSLLKSGSREMGVTPALHLPLFDAGRLRANLNSNRADVTLGLAQYEQTVQNAVAEVNDALVHADGLARERPALEQQEHARQHAQDSAARRAAAGLIDQREVLRDRLGVLALQEQQLQLHSQAVSTHIDLIKALGGGWSVDANATAAATAATAPASATVAAKP